MTCHVLHGGNVDLVLLLCAYGQLGFFSAESLAQESTGFRSLKDGDRCRFETLKGLDFLSEDMEGRLTDSRHPRFLIMHANEVSVGKRVEDIRTTTFCTGAPVDVPRPLRCSSSLCRREQVHGTSFTCNESPQLSKVDVADVFCSILLVHCPITIKCG